MEINVNEIFERMDLHQIINFILYGTGPLETYNITYNQHLTEGSIPLLDRFKKLYKDNQIELENAKDELYTALTVNSEVYTEIGMKAGARMLVQLLFQND